MIAVSSGLPFFYELCYHRGMLTLEESIAEEKKKYRDADKALNEEYRKLYSGMDGAARQKLVKAQRAWVAFRDANAVLRGDYPRNKSKQRASDKDSEFVLYSALREMTEARALELASFRMAREAAAKA